MNSCEDYLNKHSNNQAIINLNSDLKYVFIVLLACDIIHDFFLLKRGDQFLRTLVVLEALDKILFYMAERMTESLRFLFINIGLLILKNRNKQTHTFFTSTMTVNVRLDRIREIYYRLLSEDYNITNLSEINEAVCSEKVPPPSEEDLKKILKIFLIEDVNHPLVVNEEFMNNVFDTNIVSVKAGEKLLRKVFCERFRQTTKTKDIRFQITVKLDYAVDIIQISNNIHNKPLDFIERFRDVVNTQGGYGINKIHTNFNAKISTQEDLNNICDQNKNVYNMPVNPISSKACQRDKIIEDQYCRSTQYFDAQSLCYYKNYKVNTNICNPQIIDISINGNTFSRLAFNNELLIIINFEQCIIIEGLQLNKSYSAKTVAEETGQALVKTYGDLGQIMTALSCKERYVTNDIFSIITSLPLLASNKGLEVYSPRYELMIYS